MDSGFKICKRNKYGIITRVECLKCNRRFLAAFEETPNYQVRIVKTKEPRTNDESTFYSLEAGDRKEAIKPGDHIAWHRPYAIWHHGIVIENLTHSVPDEHSFTGIRCCVSCKHGCNLIASVKVIEHTFHEKQFKIKETECYLYDCMDVCRFEYSAAFPPDYTVDLAKVTLHRFQNNDMNYSFHELVYDPFGKNCEHFARRCKTGLSKSFQVKDCRRECSKGIMMSILRLVSLFIWFVCELIVDEENAPTCPKEVKCANSTFVKNKLNMMELYISVSLSAVFFLIYFLYSVFREINQVRYPFRPPDEESGCCCNNCTEDGCCYTRNCATCWCFWCLIVFRPFYECFTGCKSCIKCCSDVFGRNCKNCGLFCTNYFNIAIRVFIRELLATGLPVITFYVFEKHVSAGVCGSPTKKCICGFFVSLGVSVFSMPLAALIGSLCEIIFLGCCLSCNISDGEVNAAEGAGDAGDAGDTENGRDERDSEDSQTGSFALTHYASSLPC